MISETCDNLVHFGKKAEVRCLKCFVAPLGSLSFRHHVGPRVWLCDNPGVPWNLALPLESIYFPWWLISRRLKGKKVGNPPTEEVIETGINPCRIKRYIKASLALFEEMFFPPFLISIDDQDLKGKPLAYCSSTWLASG